MLLGGNRKDNGVRTDKAVRSSEGRGPCIGVAASKTDHIVFHCSPSVIGTTSDIGIAQSGGKCNTGLFRLLQRFIVGLVHGQDPESVVSVKHKERFFIHDFLKIRILIQCPNLDLTKISRQAGQTVGVDPGKVRMRDYFSNNIRILRIKSGSDEDPFYQCSFLFIRKDHSDHFFLKIS